MRNVDKSDVGVLDKVHSNFNITIRLEESLLYGHYFTMVNNGFVIISTNPDFALVCWWALSYPGTVSYLSFSQRGSFQRLLPAPSLCINDYSLRLFRSELCCMACLSGQCDTLNSAAVRALWSLNYACAINCETQHIRIGLGSEWLPSTHNRCPSQISAPRRLI